MARRKFKTLPIREPNGRLSRAVEHLTEARSPAEVRRLRDAAVCGMAAPEWGTELGRLFLAGKIGPRHYEAGKRWSKLAEAYHLATAAPPEAPSKAAFTQGGQQRDADPDTDAGRRQAAREQAIVVAAQDASAALILAGTAEERAVQATCERGRAPVGEVGLAALMSGLDALATHWGLT